MTWWIGPTAVAAAEIFGGGPGYSARDAAADTNAWNRRSLQFAQRSRDMAYNETIQRRVADAKKAGLHPLFALGASSPSVAGPSFGTTSEGSHSKSGFKAAARAVEGALGARGQRQVQRQAARTAAAVGASEARRNDAEADLLRAQTAVAYQETAARHRDAAALAVANDGARSPATTVTARHVPPGKLKTEPALSMRENEMVFPDGSRIPLVSEEALGEGAELINLTRYFGKQLGDDLNYLGGRVSARPTYRLRDRAEKRRTKLKRKLDKEREMLRYRLRRGAANPTAPWNRR